MDDHLISGTDFESVFNFLYNYYFPCLLLGSVRLLGKKTFLFIDLVTAIGFELIDGYIRPSMEYCDRFR